MRIRQYIPILAASTAFLAGSPYDASASGRRYALPIPNQEIKQLLERRNIEPRSGRIGISALAFLIIAAGVGRSYIKEHKNGRLPEED